MKRVLLRPFIRCFKLGAFFLLLFLPSCKSSLEESELEKIYQANVVKEVISRQDTDHFLHLSMPLSIGREVYPWDEVSPLKFPKITKEYFRCKGDNQNPSLLLPDKERLFDCAGFTRHSLPLKNEKEYIYPILLDLLNYLQNELDAKVIITCGHRCPKHNRYSDSSELNRTSKHMIGAEVDFYVQGYEKKAEHVILLLQNYYSDSKEYNDDKAYTKFERYYKSDTNVKTPPWYNKEIFVKLYQSSEGRDKDNNHSFPYISIQVRYDKEEQERVTYTWKQAFYSYLRY